MKWALRRRLGRVRVGGRVRGDFGEMSKGKRGDEFRRLVRREDAGRELGARRLVRGDTGEI